MNVVLPHESGDGGDIYDGPPICLLHRGNDRSHTQKNAFGVDVHLLIPGIRIQFIRMTAADPSIVDKNIDPALPGHGRRDHIFPIRLAGHIQFLKSRRSAALTNSTNKLRAFIYQQICDHDRGALPSENFGGGCSHARGATSYNCYFVL